MTRLNVLTAAALGLIFSTQVIAQHNVLTAAEQAAGYTLLFNGTNKTGWRSWNSTTAPSGWSVAPESSWTILRLDASIGQAGSLITSDATFQSFDFKTEWNIPSAGNSGIFIRYNQFNVDAWGGVSGPESQIAANNNSDGTAALHRAGTCYDLFPIDARADLWDRPTGTNYNRYHQFRMIVYNNHVAHFGNGIKLLEYVIRSPAWTTAYNNSKYASRPLYGDVHPGAIYIQDHGEPQVKFRDVRIKKLTQNPWALGSPYLINPNDTTSGLRDLTFADNLFPPTPIFIELERASDNIRILRSGKSVSMLFGMRGNYVVTLQDLLGRSKSSQSVRGADQTSISIPTQGPQILRVQSDGRDVYRSLIAPE